MADTDTLELFGRVTQVPRLRLNEQKTFVVLAPESGKKYNCICPFFCPVQVDDTIYAVVRMCPDNTLLITRPPFMQPSATKENTVKAFVTMGGMGYNQALKFYEKLEKDHGEPIPYMSRLAERWMNTKNVKLLSEFTTMNAKEAGFFLAKWHKQRNMRRLYLMGLTKTEINQCELSTDEIYKRCLDNPLTLYGLEIKKAVEIMMRNNREPTNDDIRCAQILRTIHANSKERGWSGTPSNSVLKLYPDFPDHREKLFADYGLVGEYHTAFLKPYAQKEQCVAEYLVEMMKNSDLLIPDPYYGDDITLNKEQKRAVTMALSSGVSIITGGPGTGKSTLLSIICDNLDLLELHYVMCSFTGKAVSRMKEITGREAFTIHQLIMKIKKFKDDINFKMILIDEFSMVSTPLFFELLIALKSYELPWPKIVFLGDLNQLQCIDWGDLAIEIMSIPEIPRVELIINMRVYKTLPGEKCGIISALEVFQERARDERSNRFNKSVKPKFSPKTPATFESGISGDPFDDLDPDLLEEMMLCRSKRIEGPIKEADNFFLIPSGIEMLYDIIIDVHQRGLSMYDMTIISPYNVCLPELNEKFEQIFHEGKPFVIDFWKNKWHVGSRVMCLENDYEIGVYNGTEGEVTDFTDDMLKIQITETKIIERDGKKKAVKMNRIIDVPLKPKYNRKTPPIDPETGEVIDTDEGLTTKKFMLSYAVTTHKAQGNQSNYVVYYIPFGKGSSSFINRNQTYTAISRGRRAVWVCGDVDVFMSSLDRGPAFKHNTLTARIRSELDRKSKFLAVENKQETFGDFVNGVD